MLEIAGGIVLAVLFILALPYLLTFLMFLVPPMLGVLAGGFAGYVLGGGGAVITGAVIGGIGGVLYDFHIVLEDPTRIDP